MNKAVTQLHQLPWSTQYLHFPYGTSLLGQTLNPFNGFLAVGLLRLMSLNEAYNVIVIFSFVAGGLTMFWLCYDVTRSYLGSLVGGFIFTFSSYHVAHAGRHMQLEALEWVPLFLFCWRRLLLTPSVGLALASAAVLFADILCDYYYFFYCVMVACLMVAWRMVQQRDWLLLLRPAMRLPLITFLAAAAASSGVLVFHLAFLNHTDPLLGAHDPSTYSADLQGPFIYGQTWRFAGLTRRFWSHWTGNKAEDGVGLGLSVLFLMGYAWTRRRRYAGRETTFWLGIAVLFFLFSLGPALRFGGRVVYASHMPYHLLADRLMPWMSLSGVPARMIVVTFVAASILAAMGIRGLSERGRFGRLLTTALLLVMFVKYLPGPMAHFPVGYPNFVRFLQQQPGHEAVLLTSCVDQEYPDFKKGLYYQTGYDSPQAFGYISRTPTSVQRSDDGLNSTLNHGLFSVLYRQYRIRYLVASAATPNVPSPAFTPVYQDQNYRIYDLSLAR